ncbi:MAG: hypothetical protein KDJ16_06295, partial [Hyphomicrobiales bacterium]|nr:hypothetical protein [Hyphomicrobiales bacterium]
MARPDPCQDHGNNEKSPNSRNHIANLETFEKSSIRHRQPRQQDSNPSPGQRASQSADRAVIDFPTPISKTSNARHSLRYDIGRAERD